MDELNIIQDSDFITAKEVSALYNISDTTVWNYAKEGILKKYRAGKRSVKFKKSEVSQVFTPQANG